MTGEISSMSKATLQMEIALLDLEHEVPEKKVQKKTTRHMTPEFRKKCSERMRRQWSDPEWKERQLVHLRSMEHTGHPQTPETRKKMRLAWTEERRQRQSEALKKAFSEAKMKEKLSQRVSGYSWWHKGTESTLSLECPGEGWERGRYK